MKTSDALSRPRFWWITLLTVAALSITVNLLLLGWIAGTRAGEPARLGRGALRELVRTLPPPMQAQARAALREHVPELVGHARAVRRARREIAGLLRAERFDRAAAERQLASVRRHTIAAQELLQQALLDVAEKTDAQTRRRWAARWSRADDSLPPAGIEAVEPPP